MKRKNKVVFNIFNIFLLVVLCAFSFVSPFAFRVANAVTVTGYSSVLGDLKIDENFNEEDYPSDPKDYSINVIQVAESTGGELFIYVYQPSALTTTLIATSINISQTIEESLNYKNYKLQLLDSDGVFAKYKVIGIELKTDVIRYYDISSIFRKFNASVDTEQDNDNTTTEKSCEVSQQWWVTTLNGEVYYNCYETEVVTITDKYVGFVRYKDNTAPSWINKDSVDSHFVAFSTDRDIDKLIEADVYYTSQTYFTSSDLFVPDKYGDVIENYVSLSYTNKVVVDGDDSLFWGTNKYEFNEIQTVSEFFDSVDTSTIYEHGIFNTGTLSTLKDETRQLIENMQFVLRFANTDYDHFESSSLYPVITDSYTIVQDVTILRLKFETNGVVYNLGVIDNKTNGNGIPDNINDFIIEFADWVEILFIAIGAVLFLVILLVVLQLCGVLKPVLKFIGELLLKVVKAIWWVISSPFVALISLIKKE